MSRRRFLGLIGAGAAACGLGFPAIVQARPRTKSVIVLGMDGMDPALLQRFLREGRMPNARRLMETGAFSPLQTSDPPQSPVAWSNFISGTNPGGHGIFDFIARHPATLEPYLSTSHTAGASGNLHVGQWLLPLKAAEVKNLRQGPTFWNAIEDRGISCTVLRMPANFPPTPGKARTLSGLGTPDVHGSYGIFTCFTTRPEESTRDVPGGHIEKVFIRNHAMEGDLRGPVNSFSDKGGDARLPLKVFVDPVNAAVRILIQSQDILLNEGEWSDWVKVRFPLLPGLVDAPAICRFHLQSAHNPFALYVTPLDMDPSEPFLPISTPATYSRDLAGRIGSYYTQGLPADTSALSSGVFNDNQYREQALFVLNEEFRMFESELNRFQEGFFFSYFCSLDLNSHTFWRTLDPKHPSYSPELAKAQGDFIPGLYDRMDKAIGMAMERLDGDTLLIVMSDHGFGPFRRQFNLNSWLMDNGYASPLHAGHRGEEPYFADVNWGRTKAYGLGINSLYLNIRGREPAGSVAAGGHAETLKKELSTRLLSVRDPDTGEPVISHVYNPADIYSGPCVGLAPDLIIGYAPGYRASWDTILGKYPKEIILDNKDAWSGDHATDSAFMSGVLLASRKITLDQPALSDVAPGILRTLDVPLMKGMTGQPAFE